MLRRHGSPLWLAFLIVPVAGLSGCIGSDEAVEPAAIIPDILPLLPEPNGVVQMEVPVDVVMIGFPKATVQALAGRVTTDRVHHAALDYDLGFPPVNDNTPGSLIPLGLQPTATYRVHAVGDDLTRRFFETMSANRLEARSSDIPNVFAANPIEDWLATELPASGLPLGAGRSTLVLVHAAAWFKGDHAYNVEGQTGWLEPVRYFGERTPLVVFDVSAAPDPYVGTSRPYNQVVDAEGASTVDALADLVRDVTHFRLLQGAIYPITVKPCHAVTMVLAIRQGALTEVLPGNVRAEEIIDVEGMQAGWQRVTGEANVMADLKVIHLPQDDPVLDAITRDPLIGNDAIRWWIDENWDRYWVAHDGCEPYVSFLLYGDMADTRGGGIAMYDVHDSHRISVSAVSESTRVVTEYGTGLPGSVITRDESQGEAEWLNRLFSHETGHLLGQRHPHDITMTDGGEYNPSFSSGWSSMSYQQRYRVYDFGQIDQNNYLRNRLGFLLGSAAELGLLDDAAVQDALAHAAQFHWATADRLIEEAILVAG